MADNVAILKEAYRRWHESKGKDLDAWLDIMADDVLLRSLAAGRPGVEFTSESRSKADMRRYFAGLGADWEMIHYTPETYIAEGERVAVLGTTAWRHRGTGRSFDTPKADFVTFRNGRITKFFELYDTAAVLAAASAG